MEAAEAEVDVAEAELEFSVPSLSFGNPESASNAADAALASVRSRRVFSSPRARYSISLLSLGSELNVVVVDEVAKVVEPVDLPLASVAVELFVVGVLKDLSMNLRSSSAPPATYLLGSEHSISRSACVVPASGRDLKCILLIL